MTRERIEIFFLKVYLIAIVGRLVILEWSFLLWYLITDFKTENTVKRIKANTHCPWTVLGMFLRFKLGEQVI